MKKAVIYYHTCFNRNDGPPLYYKYNLNKLPDFKVTHSQPEGNTYILNGKQDYTFWVDYGEDGLPVDHTWKLPEDGSKKIYICSDAHLGKEYRFKKAKEFDYVFFNQKNALEEYVKSKPLNKDSAYWLPHAFEPDVYKQFNIMKKYDVCFIGFCQEQKNYNGFSRVDALDRLFKEFPSFYFGQMSPLNRAMNVFEDAALKYCKSKIVFNISAKQDINMRIFEVLGTGSFLLTNWIPTLSELFEDNKHLVTYKTLDEMVEKAKYYLEHDDEREKIAEAGYNEAINKHTYAHRLNKILEIIR